MIRRSSLIEAYPYLSGRSRTPRCLPPPQRTSQAVAVADERTMVPSRDEIERYLEELDEWVVSSLHAVTPEIPPLSSIAQRIWNDLAKFGPPALPQIPGLGSFQVPPPPPPPPAPKGILETTSDWVVDHKWKAAAAGVGFVVGSGLLAGYAGYWRRNRVLSKTKKNGSRRRVAGESDVMMFYANPHFRTSRTGC